MLAVTIPDPEKARVWLADSTNTYIYCIRKKIYMQFTVHTSSKAHRPNIVLVRGERKVLGSISTGMYVR